MDALVLVDIQNDFLPGGALAVPGGDEIIPLVNHLTEQFELVVATQDWHPPNHGSFAACHPGAEIGDVIEFHGLEQTLWPVHCVQGSPGAELASGLNLERIKHIVQKGMDPDVDSYSGFFDNDRRRSTDLAAILEQAQLARVYIVGLATDYCVKFTALDARRLNLDTWIIEDACRGVNLNPGDADSAIREMRASGVRVIHSRELQAFRR